MRMEIECRDVFEQAQLVDVQKRGERCDLLSALGAVSTFHVKEEIGWP
jgi:hypothetical protein